MAVRFCHFSALVAVIGLQSAAAPVFAQEVAWTLSPQAVSGAQNVTFSLTYNTGGQNKLCCAQGGTADENCTLTLDDGQSSTAFDGGNATVTSTKSFSVQPNQGPDGPYTRQYTLTLVDHCFITLDQPNPRTGKPYIEVGSGHDQVPFIFECNP
jgi:hypothetical protein